PVLAVAVAPGPPLAVEPYVIVTVVAAASVSDDTVMVLPETDTVPEPAVVYPAAEPVVDGKLQPLGTASVTEPPEMPPAVEPYVMVSVPLPASVRLETVMVWPATERVPALAVV